MGRLQGRRAVVTGASRGIGATLAERLAAEGASVLITARTVDQHDHLAGSLNETLERCRRHGTTVVALAADLADADDRARIVPEAEAALGGPIDVMISNAAAGIHQLAAEMNLKRRRIMFEVNFHAPIDLAQAVIPSMRERGEGWIVNVTSGSAQITDGPPFPSSAMGTTNCAYGATKAALNRYTNILAIELYGTGIRVNTIEPDQPVATEGAMAHLGDRIDADKFEPAEVMVEGTLALCDGPPDLTGGIFGDQRLLARLGHTVMTLDGRAPLAGWPRSS